jgi:Domain of unknown function (DUF1911)/Domain of unknown function (DUF1910)
MIRASIGNKEYWEECVAYSSKREKIEWELINQPSKNPNFDPEYTWRTTRNAFRYIANRYSRGDPIPELSQHFAGLLDAWELSNKLAAEVNAQLKPGEGWDHRHIGAARISDDPRVHSDPRAWVFSLSNLNHYNWCFWLVGLGLTLEIPEVQWERLVTLIGGEGEDILLDRVICQRSPRRKIGTHLLHEKPYARLLKAVDTPLDMQTAYSLKTRPYSLNFKNDAAIGKQAAMLREFIDHWYVELARKSAEELWWYTFGDPIKSPLEKGSYFGRWCIEAAAAVKAFGLDDSLCLGHEHYPGDLLRPNGPSTHPAREEAPEPTRSWFSRLFEKKKR